MADTFPHIAIFEKLVKSTVSRYASGSACVDVCSVSGGTAEYTSCSSYGVYAQDSANMNVGSATGGDNAYTFSTGIDKHGSGVINAGTAAGGIIRDTAMAHTIT
ncbi:hypothetical protein SDC9_53732 [bioreactor metagenome]|uniref:Uncharacterized protein n=1 Tax=bioreactor metagenome TaxID=1076179 RepID=A0A644WU18_9ZZZZ